LEIGITPSWLHPWFYLGRLAAAWVSFSFASRCSSSLSEIAPPDESLLPFDDMACLSPSRGRVEVGVERVEFTSNERGDELKERGTRVPDCEFFYLFE